jgi:hypothetical protein
VPFIIDFSFSLWQNDYGTIINVLCRNVNINFEVKEGDAYMQKKIEELAKKERNAYIKKWRSKNKEKIKIYNANYWRRRAEKRMAERNLNERRTKY